MKITENNFEQKAQNKSRLQFIHLLVPVAKHRLNSYDCLASVNKKKQILHKWNSIFKSTSPWNDQ